MSRGARAIIMIQSSRNRTLLRILRPQRRTRMMTREKPVHHQEKSKVGSLAARVRDGGGDVSHAGIVAAQPGEGEQRVEGSNADGEAAKCLSRHEVVWRQ